MQQQVIAGLMKLFEGGTLLQEAQKLMDNMGFQKELKELESHPQYPLILVTFAQFVHGQGLRRIEPTIMRSLYDCGWIVSPFVENVLDKYRDCKLFSDINSAPLRCPIYSRDGKYYSVCDSKGVDMIDNTWVLSKAYLYVHPLKEEKLDEFQTFYPISLYISSFWEGVSHVKLGALLPPWHPVLIIRLEYASKVVRWMTIDCGYVGVGIVSAPGKYRDAGPPIKDLMPENWQQARMLKYFDRNESPVLLRRQLYCFLHYAESNSEPINLKYHLEKYKDDVIAGVTSYCSTTCWGFINGLLNLFTTYQLTPEILAQELNK